MTMLKSVSTALLLAAVSISAHAVSPGELRQKYVSDIAPVETLIDFANDDEAVLVLEDKIVTPAQNDIADTEQEKSE